MDLVKCSHCLFFRKAAFDNGFISCSTCGKVIVEWTAKDFAKRRAKGVKKGVMSWKKRKAETSSQKMIQVNACSKASLRY